MIKTEDIRQKLERQWRRFGWHKAWLNQELVFPHRVGLPRPTDKQLLHEFDAIRRQLGQLRSDLQGVRGLVLIEQEFQFATMGRQCLPVAIEFADMAALARFLGKHQAWHAFVADCERIRADFPALGPWLGQAPASVDKYRGRWPRLLAVCRYLAARPRPGLYLRQLDIPGVDSKFIEAHKGILKTLLDQVLPASAIDPRFDGLNEQGFEKRYGLDHEGPAIRFRLLDPALAAEFGGLTDLSIPLTDFARLALLVDRVFITENKVNGLAFPSVRNALVIFGLGYGVQALREVPWLRDCRLHYWGDIDSHGFAMLSQLRGYFPLAASLLMDEATLLHCRPLWGEEPVGKGHPADWLPHLTETEQRLYQRLKEGYWQPRLRMEQERIPFTLLETALSSLP